MASAPWSAFPSFSLPRFGRRPVQGLVLGGGGSKASFQLGALRYLYDHEPTFHPSVITATSAGAIIGCMLAQYPLRDDQDAALRRLEAIWLALETPHEMFAQRRWFAQLQAHVPELTPLLRRAAEHTVPAQGRLRERRGFQRFRRAPTEVAVEPEPSPDPSGMHPMLGFDPEPAYPRTEIEWSPGYVMELMSALPSIGRATGDLPSILRAAERTQSAYRPGPVLRQLLAPENFSPTRLAQSSVRLRMAMVSLTTGELRYMRGDGVVVDRSDRPLSSERQDPLLGVLASCSIPGVFAPVPLLKEHFVDGGVRENLPVEAAIANLGSRETWVLVSAGAEVTRHDAGAMPLWQVVQRSTQVLADEALRDEVAYARAAGARVVEPEIEVHGPMEVDRGLLRINYDYGWMRAREVALGLDEASEDAHLDLVRLRLRAWRLERDLDQERSTTPEDDAAELRTVKQRLSVGVAAFPKQALPPGADRWGTDSELHSPPGR